MLLFFLWTTYEGSNMGKENTGLMVQPKVNTVNTLRNLANAIEAGEIRDYSLQQDSNGSITVKADSKDGKSRLIQTSQTMDGYSSVSTEHVEKMPPKKRRKVVLKMAKEGKTQTEIAEKTIVSQKTISNDIAKLREQGKL